MESMPLDEARASYPAPVRLEARARFEVLGAILLALLLGALDQTIVGVALPRIVTDLHGNDLYTWAVTIYLLTSTISVPFWGKLSDLYGRKTMLVIGISIFLVGSALCGLSQEMWQLILFRGFQGIGAGSLFPISLAVIGDLFTPAERGKYQGLFAAVFGFAALVGPALGGLLTDVISWHAIFYVNIPVGLISLVVIWRVMPQLRRPGSHHDLDILGAAVFTAAVAPFLVGLTNAQSDDWLSLPVAGLIGLGLALFLVFLFVETRAKEPIIPLHLFRGRTYSATIAATFFASFGFFAAVVFLPLYFQVVQSKSATESGYLMFPLLIGVMSGSVLSGQIISRTGKYKVLILGSLTLLAIGSFLLTHLTAQTDYLTMAAWMLVAGLGIGPTLAAFTIVIQNAVPMRELGVATSSLTFFRQIGGSVGLAVAGSLFSNRLAAYVPEQLAAAGVPSQFASRFDGANFSQNDLGAGVDLNAILTQAIQTAPIPAAFKQQAMTLIPTIEKAFFQAMSLAIGNVFWLGVGAAVLAFAATLLMKELPLRKSFAPEGPAVMGEAGGVPAPQTSDSPTGVLTPGGQDLPAGATGATALRERGYTKVGRATD
ncbi:MAG TPA: MDR family MFS transporter [Candidatus Dormibacteraeota bacterium]|nr:MDR family MFS transporter [Candidatus Dormibacteraeota bacterium]